MRLTRTAIAAFALALAAGPGLAQQSSQPSLLDQARRALGGQDDQDAQRRAYEQGRRDEQMRQDDRDRDRDRRADDRRRTDDRRDYGTGSDTRRPPSYDGGSDRDRYDPNYRR